MRKNKLNLFGGDNSDHTIVVTFPANNLLPVVLGALDENLNHLAQKHSVEAISWGGSVSISGKKRDCENAKTELNEIYFEELKSQANKKNIIQMHPKTYSSYSSNFADKSRDYSIADAKRNSFSPASATAAANAPVNAKNARNTYGKKKYKSHQRILPTNDEFSINYEAVIENNQQATFEFRNESQRRLHAATFQSSVVFACGAAGSGKTFAAVATGLDHLKRGNAKRLVLSRPVVESGEKLGFLPGSINEKIDPYFRPIFDILLNFMSAKTLKDNLNSGVLELAPIAYMRGRTISDSFVILDEAQNTTKSQMQMFLTRIGNNSVFCVTGDPSQVDIGEREISGLSDATRRLSNINGVEIVPFSVGDVVRHPLVGKIISAYNEQ